MPALIQSDYTATITWLGRVPEDPDGIRSEALTETHATLDGFPGESHGGTARAACSRFTMLYPQGAHVRNTRQLSILSEEEMAKIAATLGLAKLDPIHLGASLVLSGIPDLSHLPPGARLKAAAGTVITIDLENGPCQFPAKEIEKDSPGHGKGFKAAAEGRRGTTAWVEREGPLKLGDTLALYLPTQPIWAPMQVQKAAE